PLTYTTLFRSSGAAAARRRHRGGPGGARAFAARGPAARRRPGVVMALFAAISVALAIGVFAAVLGPLWRQSRRVALVGVLAFSLVALALYRLVGTPAAIDAPAPPPTPRTMEEAVVQLEAELERNPQRADGWQLLARSYEMLGRRIEASDAYARAVVLDPDNPDLLRSEG